MSFVTDSLRADAIRDGAPGSLLALRIELAASEGAALRLFDSHPTSPRFYWDQPEVGHAVCGVGALQRVEAGGAARFEGAADGCRAIVNELRVIGVEAPAWAGPLLVGGFAFEPDSSNDPTSEWRNFAPISFVLPELCYVRDGGRAWLTAIGVDAQVLVDRLETCAAELVAASAGDVLERPPATATAYTARPDRPHTEWLAGVEAAVASMAHGDFEKVVLARSLGVETDVAYDAVSVLAALRRVQPSCATFAVTRGERVFLGASPERLVRLDGDRLSSAALAGSAPRGRSPEEDSRLARALRESKKEQEEHAFVVREIVAALEPLCESVVLPEAPGLLALEGIQHLETSFEARLKGGLEPRPHLLDVAARLHPTPAVCGTPRERAADWLRQHEGLERGWYAGGVGYVDAQGGGEIGVALRSGLLSGSTARLYAGAGLVAASKPEAELAETRLKLRTLLSQLTEI